MVCSRVMDEVIQSIMPEDILQEVSKNLQIAFSGGKHSYKFAVRSSATGMLEHYFLFRYNNVTNMLFLRFISPFKLRYYDSLEKINTVRHGYGNTFQYEYTSYALNCINWKIIIKYLFDITRMRMQTLFPKKLPEFIIIHPDYLYF